jgi:hypothetical protein
VRRRIFCSCERASRPARIDKGRAATRWFLGSFAFGIIVLGLIGLFRPSAFSPGSRPLSAGGVTLVLAGLVAFVGLLLAVRIRHLQWVFKRIREPFVRPLEEIPHFQGAADALAECSAAQQSRWATTWVWMPALLATGGVTFAFSCAYFVVAGILSAGHISWGNPLLAAINAVLSIVSFTVGAGRLATWRVALSAHRDVTGRYES